MAKSGHLDVTVDSTSSFLSTNLPYVVRDARLAVVHTGTVGGGRIKLPEGLYSVEVMAPNGTQTTSVVQVQPNDTARVDVPAEAGTPTDIAEVPSRSWGPAGQWALQPSGGVRHDPHLELEAIRGPLPLDRAPIPTLVAQSGCMHHQIGDTSWEFLPANPFEQVATAVFTFGARLIEMSLAVNPLGGGSAELQACRVDRVQDPDGIYRLRMSFAAGRALCVTMDGLLRNKSASAAADLLEKATGLLWGKYDDPPAAALGGLILHGMGRLDERAQWARNLAHSFRWLPDGQILYAALLMKDPDQEKLSEGLQLLLSATTKRPLYTDGLSLAMELLRRWPDDESLPLRTERLASLAKYSAYADWDSINLAVDTTEGPADPRPPRW
jgi:hypothetical protein